MTWLRFTLVAALAWLLAMPAAALTPDQRAAVLGGLPNFDVGATVALEFQGVGCAGRPCYKVGSLRSRQFTRLPGLSVSRASVGYAANADGSLVLFPANAPRITNQGLLVEEARTNLAVRSQGYTIAPWTTFNATPSATSLVAPDGTATGETITAASGNAAHAIYQSITITSGTTYAASTYFEAGTARYAYISLQTSPNGNYATAIFDLQGGGSAATQTAVGGSSGTIAFTSQQCWASGWCRLALIGSITGTAGHLEIGIAGTATANTIAATGSPTFTAAGTETLGVWQTDLQSGSFIASPIPTTSASATKAQDVVKITGLSGFDAAATVIASGTPQSTGAVTPQDPLELGDGTSNNILRIARLGSSSSYNSDAVVAANSVAIYNVQGLTWTLGSAATLGLSAVAGAQVASFAGSTIAAGSNAAFPVSLTKVFIGNNDGFATTWNGYLTRVLLYPRAFSQTELNAATSQ